MIEQLAMFMQARDAHQNGKWPDGLLHPTWEEIGEPGQEAYRTDAQAFVRAMTLVGAPAVGELREARAEAWDEAVGAVFAWWQASEDQRPAAIVNPYGIGIRDEGEHV